MDLNTPPHLHGGQPLVNICIYFGILPYFIMCLLGACYISWWWWRGGGGGERRCQSREQSNHIWRFKLLWMFLLGVLLLCFFVCYWLYICITYYILLMLMLLLCFAWDKKRMHFPIWLGALTSFSFSSFKPTTPTKDSATSRTIGVLFGCPFRPPSLALFAPHPAM